MRFVLLWVGSTGSDVVMIEFGVQVIHYESTPGGEGKDVKKVNFGTIPRQSFGQLESGGEGIFKSWVHHHWIKVAGLHTPPLTGNEVPEKA